MSLNSAEKQAQKLNQLLRTEGKHFGKAWRLAVRQLLMQMFEALNKAPVDGARCLEICQRIDAEIEAVACGKSTLIEGDPNARTGDDAPPKKGKKTKNSAPPLASQNAQAKEPPPKDAVPELVPQNAQPSERMGFAHSDDPTPRMGEAHSGASDPKGTAPKDAPQDVGLFDLIHVQIRCFFTLHACVQPPYIGKFVQRAQKFGQASQERIDRFIGVLSKNEDAFAAKSDIEIGYNDDLLPDMPERGLVLHPKKKKKS